MQKTTTSKLLVIIGSLLLLAGMGLLWAAFPPSHVSAGFTPTSAPPPGGGGGDGGGDGGNPCREGAIYGSVTDLCLGEPARGVQVRINGDTINTDGDGRFSRTGLSPGTYNISLLVSGEWRPSSASVTIHTCGQQESAGLNYNSCFAPTISPTPTGIFFLPETGTTASGVPLVLIVFLVGLGLVTLGIYQYKTG